jgi:hypothetical protein
MKAMKISLDEDQAALALRAVEQYVAYLVSQNRQDPRFAPLADLLRSANAEMRKPPQSQDSPQRTRSRAHNRHPQSLSAMVSVRSWKCPSSMKTISPDRAYIDYWQDYGTGKKSHFGIRVWADHCSAITNVAAENPSSFGGTHPLPIEPTGKGQHSLNNVIDEHMARHPDSDLVAVLTRAKAFRDAVAG